MARPQSDDAVKDVNCGNDVTDKNNDVTDKNNDVTDKNNYVTDKNNDVTNKQSRGGLDDKMAVVMAHWRQRVVAGRQESHVTLGEITDYIRGVLQEREGNLREDLKEVTEFITSTFSQRSCIKFCPQKESKLLEEVKESLLKSGTPLEKDYCWCGEERDYHEGGPDTDSGEAATLTSSAWSVDRNTATTSTTCFGNIDIPGKQEDIQLPTPSRKYILLDDATSEADDIWQLLTSYWKLDSPSLLISVSGGETSVLQDNEQLLNHFKQGMIKVALTTGAWVTTDGLSNGTARLLGDLFSEALPDCEWNTSDPRAAPLIGVAPWGIIASPHHLHGIHVGQNEAAYTFPAHAWSSGREAVNCLQPSHSVYLLADNGTRGQYNKEPELRTRLELYIAKHISPQTLGQEEVRIPVVFVIVGGDVFTLAKLHTLMTHCESVAVVIVEGSGGLADLLAKVYHKLEETHPRKNTLDADHYLKTLTQPETEVINEAIRGQRSDALLRSEDEERYLKEIMTSRHRIQIFGISERSNPDLDGAVLQAICQASGPMDVLGMAISMDRCDIAESFILSERNQPLIKEKGSILQKAMMMALENHNVKFVELLLKHNIGGDTVDLNNVLTVGRLRHLHATNLQSSSIFGKLLRTYCLLDHNGNLNLSKADQLPQVGRMISLLMGSHYRILYQQKIYNDGEEEVIPWELAYRPEEEAVWHLLLWAILTNKIELTEFFIAHTSCKTGAALIAYQILATLAHRSKRFAEHDLGQELKDNAEHFQTLAVETLAELYEMDRHAAYSDLVCVLPFSLGRFVTPLSLAYDAGAMRFVSTSCCQTFLHLVWMNNIDMANHYWKLLPFFVLCPFFNVPFITYDTTSLAFGAYQKSLPGAKTKITKIPLDKKIYTKKYHSPSSTVREPDSGSKLKNRNITIWYKLRKYYTAPFNKFYFGLLVYVIYLGIFTHLVLTHLAPVVTWRDITGWEWAVIMWVLGISLEEFKQIFLRDLSGPLYGRVAGEYRSGWLSTFTLGERLQIHLRLYTLLYWIRDRWNQYDLFMLTLFLVALILRFTLNPTDFAVARLFYVLSLIAFYLRLLRMGYILEDLGPRIITIGAMFRDLFYFIIILLVFIVSFGVSFEAFLNPNSSPSWQLFVNILWKPYWAMMGDSFLQDPVEDTGASFNNGSCVVSRNPANIADSASLEGCLTWVVPVLLAAFMLIANILLLNLLIAIFSYSFTVIQESSGTIWRYNLCGLMYEFCHQSWLPPPCNILCHLANLLLWLIKWPRRCCYLVAVKKHKVHDTRTAEKRSGSEKSHSPKRNVKRCEDWCAVEESVSRDSCYPCYYGERHRADHETSYFCQNACYRNVGMEDRAYKRFVRKRDTTETPGGQTLDTHSMRSSPHRTQQQLWHRMETVEGKLDHVARDLQLVLAKLNQLHEIS